MDRTQRIFAAIGATSLIGAAAFVLAYPPFWSWTEPDTRTCEELRRALPYATREHEEATRGYARCVLGGDPVACDTYSLEEVSIADRHASRLGDRIAERCPLIPVSAASPGR